jgi:sugar phosphate permease
MKLDAHGATSASNVKEEKFSWHWVKLALNLNTILLSIDFFTVITPIYSFSLFLPTIISAMGYTKVNANLMSVPPNVAAFLTVILVTYLSDKYKRRGVFMLSGATLSIVGYIMLISSARPLTQYGGTFLVGAGIFPTAPIVMGWLANNTGPHYVRATATGFQIAFANCAAFIATFTYISTDAPRYLHTTPFSPNTTGMQADILEIHYRPRDQYWRLGSLSCSHLDHNGLLQAGKCKA